MTRQISDRMVLSTNGDSFTTMFKTARGLESTVVYLSISLNGAISGTNTCSVVLQATPDAQNGSNATFFDEDDTSAFPSIVVNEIQANTVYKKVLHVKGDYGVCRLKFTRAGTGSNGFVVSMWFSP